MFDFVRFVYDQTIQSKNLSNIMMATSKKSEYIWIRAEPRLKMAIEEKAKEEGLTVSQYARNILNNYIFGNGALESPMTETEKQEIANRVMEGILDSDEYRAKQKELMKELLKEIAE